MDKVLFEKEVKRAWLGGSQKEVDVDKSKVHFDTFMKICEDMMDVENLSLSQISEGANRIYDAIAQINVCEDFGKAKKSARVGQYYKDLYQEYFEYIDNSGKHKITALEFIYYTYEGKIDPYHIKTNIVGTYGGFSSNTYIGKRGFKDND